MEGYISRLRHRNEAQRERLYLGTFAGSLLIFKNSRANPPPFPKHDGASSGPEESMSLDTTNGTHVTQDVLGAFYRKENDRLASMIVHCKGAIRLRDITSVELSDSCQHCRSSGGEDKDKATPTGPTDASKRTGDHDHAIVHISLTEDRQFRFEVSIILMWLTYSMITNWPILSKLVTQNRLHRRILLENGSAGLVAWSSTGQSESKLTLKCSCP